MFNPMAASISVHFAPLKDPRVERTRQHNLMDILAISICAVICGADGWVAIEEFGKSKEDWFRTFLDLPGGIPSHDTFGRVFAAMEPEAFAQSFSSWIAAVATVSEGEIVAIDGKTLRKSFDNASNKAAIHMVSAWASQNNLVLGQVKTEEKSNEIVAIPKLLEMLHIQGCIVTIDAMGCQKKIAAKIIEKSGDYVLSLKDNHPTFHNEVIELFEWADKKGFEGIEHDYFEETDGEHGRIEVRRAWSLSYVDWFEDKDQWKGLSSFLKIESERIVGGKKSVEHRFYISSLDGSNAARLAKAVRSHWNIENKLHWVLDVAFDEDNSRVRKGFASENLAILRHIALNLLKQEKSSKVGIKNKRLKAGWDETYLLKILNF